MPDDPHSIPNPKIHPARRPPAGTPMKPDNTPDYEDRVEIGPTRRAFMEWATAGIDPPDLQVMRRYRKDRLIKAIAERGYAGVLLFDPLSIRYATDTTNMQVWNTHNPFRACLVTADGNIVLWEYGGYGYFSEYSDMVDEVRTGASFFYFATGKRTEEKAHLFAHQINDLLRDHCGDNRRLAVDKIQIEGFRALDSLNIRIMDGEELMEHTRAIKGPDEIKAMRCAMHACEASIAEMREKTQPGMSENDIWAELHASNIRRGGEWIETRILSTGQRTNPWFQESGPRLLKNNEILSFDTDLIGCYGMCADISRSWFIGDGKPTDRQRKMHDVALEHITINTDIIKPGMTFKEISLGGHHLPDIYIPQRYGSKMHGVGLCDEYPAIKYPVDWEERGYDGVLEPGMMLCVEAYIGEVGGPDGIKLEDQVLVTETGVENLTACPFDPLLLG